jgi:hypothetical protein
MAYRASPRPYRTAQEGGVWFACVRYFAGTVSG